MGNSDVPLHTPDAAPSVPRQAALLLRPLHPGRPLLGRWGCYLPRRLPVDEDGYPALYLAAWKRCPLLHRLLLAAGGDPGTRV